MDGEDRPVAFEIEAARRAQDGHRGLLAQIVETAVDRALDILHLAAQLARLGRDLDGEGLVREDKGERENQQAHGCRHLGSSVEASWLKPFNILSRSVRISR